MTRVHLLAALASVGALLSRASVVQSFQDLKPRTITQRAELENPPVGTFSVTWTHSGVTITLILSGSHV